MPSSSKELQKLKGIGNYTAAAIASFAFKESVPVIDGNIYRVLARIFGINNNIHTTKGKKIFYDLANEILPLKDSHIYNQAIMEFGAINCTPLNPKCNTCFATNICFAYKNNDQEKLPNRKRLIEKRIRHFYYLVLNTKNHLLFRKRKKGDIWEGLYDFYLIESDKAIAYSILMDIIKEKFISIKKNYDYDIEHVSRNYAHSLTHQEIIAIFIRVSISEKDLEKLSKTLNLSIVQKGNSKTLPIPVLISNYLSNNNLQGVFMI